MYYFVSTQVVLYTSFFCIIQVHKYSGRKNLGFCKNFLFKSGKLMWGFNNFLHCNYSLMLEVTTGPVIAKRIPVEFGLIVSLCSKNFPLSGGRVKFNIFLSFLMK